MVSANVIGDIGGFWERKRTDRAGFQLHHSLAVQPVSPFTGAAVKLDQIGHHVVSIP